MSATSTWPRPEPLPPVPARPARRPLLGWHEVLAALVVVVVGGWWVAGSRIFDLRTVRVAGARHLSRAEVTRLGGLSPSTNVLWLSPGKVEERLQRSPWVLRASVVRHFPSEVSVTIVERVPVAVTAGRRRFLVAADGVVLAPAGTGVRLPRITPPTPVRGVGQRLGRLPQLEAAGALNRVLRRRVGTIEATPGGGLLLVLRGGAVVAFGDPGEARAKAAALWAVLRWAQAHGVRPARIDVTAPTAPAIQPA